MGTRYKLADTHQVEAIIRTCLLGVDIDKELEFSHSETQLTVVPVQGGDPTILGAIAAGLIEISLQSPEYSCILGTYSVILNQVEGYLVLVDVARTLFGLTGQVS